MTITHLNDGIVSGMILGDGHIDQRYGTTLQLSHTLPQNNYLNFKLSLLNQLGYNTRKFNRTTKRTNLGLVDYCSGTANGKNHDMRRFQNAPLSTLLGNLNPLGLLIWWLDDGSLTVHQKKSGSISRFGYLSTQGYGLEGNELIKEFFSSRFGIETTIHIDSKSGFAKSDHYRIYINATNFRRLIDLVREFIPWIPRDMRYKLNMQYVVNRNKDSLILATHYNF